MAQARLSTRKIREVLRLKAEARLSDRQIATAVGGLAFDGAGVSASLPRNRHKLATADGA